MSPKTTSTEESEVQGWETQYCKIDNVIQRQNYEYSRITLAMPVSFDRLNTSLTSKIENWDGPISLTVVFPESAELRHFQCVSHSLRSIRRIPKAAEYLSVHFLIEGTKDKCDTILASLNPIERPTSCSPPNYSAEELLHLYTNFPINIARNYARNMTTTKYIVIADMEHYFSENFEAKVLGLAERVLKGNGTKTALVYRIFEIEDEQFRIKETKAGLRTLLAKNQAQQFHEFHHAHLISRLVEWILASDDGPNTTTIQFIKPYTIHQWEPQFVALTEGLPYHDINFKFPWSDNRNPRWEMCRAGYQWAVMNDVFMYHPGIRTPDSNLLYDQARKIVWPHNMLALEKFRERMDRLYPETKNECPKFTSL